MLDKPIGILLVEADPRLREALGAVIASEPAFQLTAMCGTRREALQVIRETPLDMVLVSLTLPDGSGLDVVTLAKEIHPSSEVLVMASAHDKEDLYLSISAGATGCLLKENLVQPDKNLRNSILASVMFTRAFCKVSAARVETSGRQTRISGLSARQTRILQCLATGATNKEIARRLILTSYNVDYHLRRLRKRFSVHNRVQLIDAAKALFDQ